MRSRLLLVCALLACATAARAQSAVPSVEEVYKGKTLRVLVPSSPGGDRVLYTMPVVTYLGRHIPGQPQVVPIFMPGAGGVIAINNLYSVAAPDGLSIGTPLAPVVIAQASGDPSVKYDVRRFDWIGRTADANRILVVWHTVPVRTLDDMRRREIVVGTTGPASETSINPLIMNTLLGTKFKMVLGYKGTGDLSHAMERGETEGEFTTWSNIATNHPGWVRDGKVRILMQIGLSRHPDLAEVPLLSELAPDGEAREVIEFMSSSSQMGQSFCTPPGVAPHLVEALRKAFDATMKDPEFLAAATKARLQINPMGGAALSDVVAKTIGAPARVIERYRAALATN